MPVNTKKPSGEICRRMDPVRMPPYKLPISTDSESESEESKEDGNSSSMLNRVLANILKKNQPKESKSVFSKISPIKVRQSILARAVRPMISSTPKLNEQSAWDNNVSLRTSPSISPITTGNRSPEIKHKNEVYKVPPPSKVVKDRPKNASSVKDPLNNASRSTNNSKCVSRNIENEAPNPSNRKKPKLTSSVKDQLNNVSRSMNNSKCVSRNIESEAPSPSNRKKPKLTSSVKDQLINVSRSANHSNCISRNIESEAPSTLKRKKPKLTSSFKDQINNVSRSIDHSKCVSRNIESEAPSQSKTKIPKLTFSDKVQLNNVPISADNSKYASRGIDNEAPCQSKTQMMPKMTSHKSKIERLHQILESIAQTNTSTSFSIHLNENDSDCKGIKKIHARKSGIKKKARGLFRTSVGGKVNNEALKQNSMEQKQKLDVMEIHDMFLDGDGGNSIKFTPSSIASSLESFKSAVPLPIDKGVPWRISNDVADMLQYKKTGLRNKSRDAEKDRLQSKKVLDSIVADWSTANDKTEVQEKESHQLGDACNNQMIDNISDDESANIPIHKKATRYKSIFFHRRKSRNNTTNSQLLVSDNSARKSRRKSIESIIKSLLTEEQETLKNDSSKRSGKNQKINAIESTRHSDTQIIFTEEQQDILMRVLQPEEREILKNDISKRSEINRKIKSIDAKQQLDTDIEMMESMLPEEIAKNYSGKRSNGKHPKIKTVEPPQQSDAESEMMEPMQFEEILKIGTSKRKSGKNAKIKAAEPTQQSDAESEMMEPMQLEEISEIDTSKRKSGKNGKIKAAEPTQQSDAESDMMEPMQPEEISKIGTSKRKSGKNRKIKAAEPTQQSDAESDMMEPMQPEEILKNDTRKRSSGKNRTTRKFEKILKTNNGERKSSKLLRINLIRSPPMSDTEIAVLESIQPKDPKKSKEPSRNSNYISGILRLSITPEIPSDDEIIQPKVTVLDNHLLVRGYTYNAEPVEDDGMCTNSATTSHIKKLSPPKRNRKKPKMTTKTDALPSTSADHNLSIRRSTRVRKPVVQESNTYLFGSGKHNSVFKYLSTLNASSDMYEKISAKYKPKNKNDRKKVHEDGGTEETKTKIPKNKAKKTNVNNTTKKTHKKEMPNREQSPPANLTPINHDDFCGVEESHVKEGITKQKDKKSKVNNTTRKTRQKEKPNREQSPHANFTPPVHHHDDFCGVEESHVKEGETKEKDKEVQEQSDVFDLPRFSQHDDFCRTNKDSGLGTLSKNLQSFSLNQTVLNSNDFSNAKDVANYISRCPKRDTVNLPNSAGPLKWVNVAFSRSEKNKYKDTMLFKLEPHGFKPVSFHEFDMLCTVWSSERLEVVLHNVKWNFTKGDCFLIPASTYYTIISRSPEPVYIIYEKKICK